MKTPNKLAAVMTVILCLTPAVCVAQARGPLPIHEETPGLLAQATITPAFARLSAFGEFPGSELTSAEIRHQGNRLVYSFDLKVAGREGNEQVQIDATTGQVCRIEYSVGRNPKKYLAITAPPELVALVKLGFAAARDLVNATTENGHVLGCKLRVEQAKTVYVFDLEVGDEHIKRHALIDATTGAVLSPAQPR